MAKIQEICIYNRNVLCGGVVERYERCWKCHWNPSASYKAQNKAAEQSKPEKKQLSKRAPDDRSDKPTEPETTWEKAAELYKEGLNDHQIAELIGKSYRAVWEWRKKQGLKSNAYHLDWERGKELYDKGWNDREIADALECNASSVYTWRRNHKLPANTGCGKKAKTW